MIRVMIGVAAIVSILLVIGHALREDAAMTACMERHSHETCLRTLRP